MKKYLNVVSEEEIEALFEEACDIFQYDKELYNYHKLDLYYWENRMGRWHSEILNENDVCFETFMPFNMRAMINISLSYTRKERRSGYMFNELINRNYPILNFYGKNNKLNLYEQILIEKMKNESIFSSFKVHYENQVKEIQTEDNRLYVTIDIMNQNNFVEHVIKFRKEQKFVNLALINKYSNKKAKGYLKYEILLNEKKIQEEDLADWNQENILSVFNLTKDDTIKIRIKPLKDI